MNKHKYYVSLKTETGKIRINSNQYVCKQVGISMRFPVNLRIFIEFFQSTQAMIPNGFPIRLPVPVLLDQSQSVDRFSMLVR